MEAVEGSEAESMEKIYFLSFLLCISWQPYWTWEEPASPAQVFGKIMKLDDP